MPKFIIWFVILFSISGYVALFFRMVHPEWVWLDGVIATGYGLCFGGVMATWIKSLMDMR
jgi:hypothetical protein